jgi:hypothetical protein
MQRKSYILTPVFPCYQLEKGGNFFPNSAYLKKKQDLQMSKSDDISQKILIHFSLVFLNFILP